MAPWRSALPQQPITDHSASHGFGNDVSPDDLRRQIERVWGIATARRAWLTAADVANTLPWDEFAPLGKRARR